MSESLDGCRVAATLQNARDTLNDRPAPSAGPLAEGSVGTNAPAPTARARVIVASGSFSDANPSHDSVALTGGAFINAASSSAHNPAETNLMNPRARH